MAEEKFCRYLGEQYEPNRTKCTFHCNLPDEQTECYKTGSKYYPLKVKGLKLCHMEMVNEIYIHMPEQLEAQKEFQKILNKQNDD